jgi:hypothetical protein
MTIAENVMHWWKIGREHFDQQADDTCRREELAAVLAFGAGELREEVLVEAAEDGFSLSPRPMAPIKSMSSPRRCLSRAGRVKALGRTPLRRWLSRSMASISLPIVGCLALP